MRLRPRATLLPLPTQVLTTADVARLKNYRAVFWASKSFDGDERLARRALFARHLYWSGRISDGPYL